ncbi:MAG: alpha/beta hydrolase [Bdellovibrionota bacterium]
MKYLRLLIGGLITVQLATAQASSFTEEFANRSLVSKESMNYSELNGKTYNTKNWANPVLHNIFMVNNRSETAQYRINLNNISKMTDGKILFIDMLGAEVLDWAQLNPTKFTNQVQKFHSIAAFETTNLDLPESPFVVLFSSTSHNLLSAVTLDLVRDLTLAGNTVVMMEYPGYGGSMGTPTKASWQKASEGLVLFVKNRFPQRKIFLIGHSIGAPVAMETAAHQPKLIAGVVSHSSFYNLYEASKDSAKFLFSNWIAPLLTKLTAARENWDNGENLELLSKNNVPVLLLHGRNDASVSFRHFNLLTHKAAQLKKSNQNFPFYSHAFDSTHEDIYTNADYGKYKEIWDSIDDFMNLLITI